MEVEVIKPLKNKLTPEFVELGLSLMEAQGITNNRDSLHSILEKFNRTFEVNAKMNDIVNFYFLDIESEDVKITYQNCVQLHTETLNII